MNLFQRLMHRSCMTIIYAAAVLPQLQGRLYGWCWPLLSVNQLNFISMWHCKSLWHSRVIDNLLASAFEVFSRFNPFWRTKDATKNGEGSSTLWHLSHHREAILSPIFLVLGMRFVCVCVKHLACHVIVSNNWYAWVYISFCQRFAKLSVHQMIDG